MKVANTAVKPIKNKQKPQTITVKIPWISLLFLRDLHALKFRLQKQTNKQNPHQHFVKERNKEILSHSCLEHQRTILMNKGVMVWGEVMLV